MTNNRGYFKLFFSQRHMDMIDEIDKIDGSGLYCMYNGRFYTELRFGSSLDGITSDFDDAVVLFEGTKSEYREAKRKGRIRSLRK